MSNAAGCGRDWGLAAAADRRRSRRRRPRAAATAAAATAFAAAVEQHQSRRGISAARSRSSSGRCPTGPAICGSGAGLRDRPSCPCADSCLATRPRFSLKIDDTVPLGLFLALAVAVLPAFRGGDAQVDHLAAIVRSCATSGSAPRLPTRITLFTLPAISTSPQSQPSARPPIQ